MRLLLLFIAMTLFGCGEVGTRAGNPLVPIQLDFTSNPRSALPRVLAVSVCFESITYIPDGLPLRFVAPLWPGGSLFNINNSSVTPLFSGSFELIPGTFDAIGFQYSKSCGYAAKVVNRHGTFTFEELEGASLVFNFYRSPVTITDSSFRLSLEVSEILEHLTDAETAEKVRSILTLTGGYTQN